MSEKITLWLPEGYGKGSIVYDNDNKPHVVGELVKGVGANIRYVEETTVEIADILLAQGAKKLISIPLK